MAKGAWKGILKDDVDLSACAIKDGQQVEYACHFLRAFLIRERKASRIVPWIGLLFFPSAARNAQWAYASIVSSDLENPLDNRMRFSSTVADHKLTFLCCTDPVL